MNNCPVSNDIATYAFRDGRDVAISDAMQRHAFIHMDKMVKHLVEGGNELTFQSYPPITFQNLVDAFEGECTVSDLMMILVNDGNALLDVGFELKARMRQKATVLITDEINQNGELPNEFSLDNAA